MFTHSFLDIWPWWDVYVRVPASFSLGEHIQNGCFSLHYIFVLFRGRLLDRIQLDRSQFWGTSVEELFSGVSYFESCQWDTNLPISLHRQQHLLPASFVNSIMVTGMVAPHPLLDLHFAEDQDLWVLCVISTSPPLNLSPLEKYLSMPVFLCFSPLGSGLVIFVVELWALFIYSGY